MKFKPYEKYKKVDLPWIDEIPSHWEMNRIKQVFKIQNGYGFPIEFQGKELGEYPFLKVSDINKKGKYVSIAKNYIDNEIVLEQNYKLTPQGSIIIAKIGEALKKNHRKINKVTCLIDNNLQAMIPYGCNNIDFLYYILKIIDMDWFNNGGTIPSINNNKLLSYTITLPPKEEQDKIADFLDYNLGKIDKFVELTERQIELLKEQKEVIINDAVTKGIDKNVEYKDSGIDWIGEIPGHWEVTRLKSIVENIVSGVWGEDSKNDDNDIICIRVADFDMKKLSASKNKLTLRNIDFDKNKSRILKKGDLLLEKSGGGEKQPVGRVIQYKFEEKAVCSNFITKFTPKKLVSSKFLLFTLHNIQLRRRHIAFINQTTGIQNLDINKYFSNKILFPPKKEQEEIVAYIEKETNKIDRTIELYKNQIKLIKEYRTSLIASAVTGKIDVRDF